mgnify:CR=1 FL=1|jgi:hypothetical protein|tara:strand:+ start:6486 stop:8453 length:1968 start_codon:yes stop_codon:yes gene_type:complete
MKLEDAWLNIDVEEDSLFDPVDFIFRQGNTDDLHLRLSWLMMQPEYFSMVCKQIFNIDLLPVQALMLKEMWNRKFPMLIASRGFGKSFVLSLYSMMRAFFMPRRKIVIVGAAFRQSKVLFEYMDTIWKNAPILRDLSASNSGPRRDVDRCVMHIGDSTITCLPLGDGSKIRGQRANDIVADEFASIPREIFENVVAGFAAVSSSPVENVKRIAAGKKAKELGKEQEAIKEDELVKANQIILSGTAYYDFNHFAEYWKKWKAIINSKGNPSKLKEIFGEEEELPSGFDWKEYSIIRIPYELLPEGFMDAAQVARSKATVHSGIYQMEFGACFTTDSQGFFKRSLIESCVVKKNEPVVLPSGEVFFESVLRGDPNKRYVFGIDPASEVDNFSIIVLEQHIDHSRIVHCWTTNRSEHKDKLKRGLVKESDFYSYCSRKIRDLMKLFPCERIALDAQGGGIAIMEALHDPDKIQDGELPIWEIIDDDKEKDTDGNPGLHILEMCQFAKADWVSEANHGTRKDFEDRVLLFPYFDSVSLGLALSDDKMTKRKMDTLEDCVMEIEELKNELSLIMMSQTPSGRDKWDTPEIKLPGGRKDRLRKDRYSALIMANMAARTMRRTPPPIDYESVGGFVGGLQSKEEGPMFMGPSWWTEKMKDVY